MSQLWCFTAGAPVSVVDAVATAITARSLSAGGLRGAVEATRKVARIALWSSLGLAVLTWVSRDALFQMLRWAVRWAVVAWRVRWAVNTG